MGSPFMAVPKSSHIPVEVATGTSVKTVLQVATPSTTNIRVMAWGISFDGTSATAEPGIVVLADFDVAATVTAVSPEEYGNDDGPASLCVSGTSATGYNGSAEGSIAGSIFRDVQEVHPQTGYSLWYPDSRGPLIKPSRFLRIRTTFAVTVNCIPWIIWDEPA